MGKRANERITKRAKRYQKVSCTQMAEALRQAHKRLGIHTKDFRLCYNKQKQPTQTNTTDERNTTTNKST